MGGKVNREDPDRIGAGSSSGDSPELRTARVGALEEERDGEGEQPETGGARSPESSGAGRRRV